VEDKDLRKTAVTLLVDQSGSMRGLKINHIAVAVEHAARMLLDLGCAVEILGFTTVGWKGGNSRKQWIFDGVPRYPGRLCDLLHIIYRSADEPPTITAATLSPMVNRNNLYENVDGEAIHTGLRED
jgi:cobalamin biosynthesis protein CobT